MPKYGIQGMLYVLFSNSISQNIGMLLKNDTWTIPGTTSPLFSQGILENQIWHLRSKFAIRRNSELGIPRCPIWRRQNAVKCQIRHLQIFSKKRRNVAYEMLHFGVPARMPTNGISDATFRHFS
jgi:hypothetical protein